MDGKTARAVNKWRTDRKEKTRAMLAAFIKTKTGREVDPSTITNTCPVDGLWKIIVKEKSSIEYPKVRTSTIKQSEFVLLERALKSGKVTVRWAGDEDDDSSEDNDFEPSGSETSLMTPYVKDPLLISISPDQIPQVVRMEEENRDLKRKLLMAEQKMALLEEENKRLKRLKISK